MLQARQRGPISVSYMRAILKRIDTKSKSHKHKTNTHAQTAAKTREETDPSHRPSASLRFDPHLYAGVVACRFMWQEEAKPSDT